MTAVVGFRLAPAFALVVVAACSSRPNPPPSSEMASPPVESPAPPVPTDAPAPAVEPSASAPVGPDDPMTPASEQPESERTPGVTSGPINVRGELHPTRVQAAMRTAYPAIRECHRKALEARTVEDKPVRVALNFEVTEKGTITKLTDDTVNLNPLFSSCILLAVSAVTFQPPKRGFVSVGYQLQLTKP